MKTKKNKTIVTLFLLLCLINTTNTFAQMAEAKKIIWDVDKNIDVKVSQNVVWELLNDSNMLKDLSNGYVKSVTKAPAKGNLESIKWFFSDGNVRMGTIVQTDIENKFYVIEISKESLPEAVKSAEIAIFTKANDDGSSSIKWRANIDGKNPGKQLLLDQLNAEIAAYLIGFGKI